MRWVEFSKEEDDRFWAGISSRYSKHQIQVLKACSKRDVTPYHLVPQWLLGQAPLKGTASIPAPSLDVATRQKIEALYHFSKSGDDQPHRIAAVFVNVLLYDALFPEETRRSLPPPGQIIDFDPRVNDLEPVLAVMGKMGSRARVLASDYSTLDCVRIVSNNR